MDNEKKASAKESPLAKISMWVAIGALVVSGVATFFTIEFARKTYQTQFRPYVGVERYEITVAKSKIECIAVLNNTGLVPANNLIVEFHNWTSHMGAILEDYSTTAAAPNILMPLPDHRNYKFALSGKDKTIDELLSLDPEFEWKIEIAIRYDGVSTKGHETFLTLYYNFDSNELHHLDGYAK